MGCAVIAVGSMNPAICQDILEHFMFPYVSTSFMLSVSSRTWHLPSGPTTSD